MKTLSIAAFLLLCILFAGCQVPSGENISPENIASSQLEPPKYIPEFQILPEPLNIRHAVFAGNEIYLSTRIYQNPDTFRTEIYRGSTENLQLKKIELSLEEGEAVQAICATANHPDIAGEMIYLATGNAETIIDGQEKSYNHIIRMDQAGTVQETLDISALLPAETSGVISDMEVDREGNIYLLTRSNSYVIVLNPLGELLFTYQPNGVVTDICTAHGKVYATAHFGGITVAELQASVKEAVTVYENVGAGSSFRMAEGQENELLFNMNDEAHRYDLTTRKTVPLLKWLDCKVDIASVSGIKFLTDGRIFVIDTDSGQPEYVYLREAAPGENPDSGKETLTVYYGYLHAADTLKSAVNRFNKTNPDYRFEIAGPAYGMSDEEINRMNAELVAGKGPDVMIFWLMEGYSKNFIENKTSVLFPIESYAKMGVFTNLYDFMDTDPDFQRREEYFENIFKAFEIDGQLCYFPLTYTKDTVLVSPSDVGGKTGWTLDELMAYVAERGGRLSVVGMSNNGSTELDVLELCLRTGVKELTKGEAFDRKLMLKILTFAHQIGEAERKAGPNPSDDGLRVWCGGISNYWEVYRQLGEHPTSIGYPTERGSGALANSLALAGISSNCSAKEAAWELVSILANFNGLGIYSTSYLRKSDLEADQNYYKKQEAEYFRVSVEDVAELYQKERELIESIDTWRIQTQAELIILEEAEYYFQGVKSVEEVVDVIANRVMLYLEESK